MEIDPVEPPNTPIKTPESLPTPSVCFSPQTAVEHRDLDCGVKRVANRAPPRVAGRQERGALMDSLKEQGLLLSILRLLQNKTNTEGVSMCEANPAVDREWQYGKSEKLYL